MNIVYFHTHDTGRYIEPYGYNVDTPNLMELAREGTLFRQAFCAAPTCSPSRASLLTGRYPHNNGMLGLAHRGFELDNYNQHLASFLGSEGWETVLCGVQHVASGEKSAEKIGYQKQLVTSGEQQNAVETDRALASRAAEYIRHEADQPFFLSLGLLNTHREFPDIDENINPDYVQTPAPLPDDPDIREDMAAFYSSVQVVDHCLGLIQDALRESGLEEETIFIFTTDHGIAFPRMKCNLYDSGIGVSLLLKYPDNPGQGAAVDALVSQIDLFPTLCELTGLNRPDWLEGHSLLPLLEGSREKIRDSLFAEVTYHASYEPMRCIRTERYKYIKYFGEHEGVVPANIDESPGKSLLMEHGLLEEKRDREQLFDLYFDPQEKNNLIDENHCQDIYQQLSGELERWMVETDDPLLEGPVPLPEGAKINRISSVDPGSSDPDDYIYG